MTDTTTPETITRPTPAEVRARREKLGISRAVLMHITGLSGSRVWAAEQDDKEVSDEHRDAIKAALDDVEKNGILEMYRKTPKAKIAKPLTRAELSERLEAARDLLENAVTVKTIKDMRELAQRALTLCSTEAQPTTENDEAPDAS